MHYYSKNVEAATETGTEIRNDRAKIKKLDTSSTKKDQVSRLRSVLISKTALSSTSQPKIWNTVVACLHQNSKILYILFLKKTFQALKSQSNSKQKSCRISKRFWAFGEKVIKIIFKKEVWCDLWPLSASDFVLETTNEIPHQSQSCAGSFHLSKNLRLTR